MSRETTILSIDGKKGRSILPGIAFSFTKTQVKTKESNYVLLPYHFDLAGTDTGKTLAHLPCPKNNQLAWIDRSKAGLECLNC